MVIVLILGTIIDSASIMLIMVPLFIAAIKSFEIDLVWFGVVTVIATEVGLLTPPFGLAVFVVHSTLARSDISLKDIFVGSAPFALAVRSGAGWLYGPVSLSLLVAATAVVTALMLVIVVLFRRREGTFLTVAQLQLPAALAIILAVTVMVGIAGGRFLLEHVTNAPPLT